MEKILELQAFNMQVAEMQDNNDLSMEIGALKLEIDNCKA